MSASTVPVLVDTWQYECCGDAPVVGAGISWALNWEPENAREYPSDWGVQAPVEPVDPPGWLPPSEGGRYAVARSGSLPVFVTVPEGTRKMRLHGALHEDHHAQVPEDFPKTAGTIRRVRLCPGCAGTPLAVSPGTSGRWCRARSN